MNMCFIIAGSHERAEIVDNTSSTFGWGVEKGFRTRSVRFYSAFVSHAVVGMSPILM